MRAICICTSDRPDYVRACLNSLRHNDHDLEDWKLYVSMEPGCQKVRDIVLSIDWIPVVAWTNPRRLKPTLNTFMVYNAAFDDGAEAVLYLDDDVIVSPDAIELCNWYLQRPNLYSGIRAAGLILCNTHENNMDRPCSIAPDLAWVGHAGQGYCITAPQWFNWVKRIFFTHKAHWGGDDYDWAIAHSAVDQKMTILRPRFSRSQHIGEFGYHGTGTIFPERINSGRQGPFSVEAE